MIVPAMATRARFPNQCFHLTTLYLYQCHPRSRTHFCVTRHSETYFVGITYNWQLERTDVVVRIRQSAVDTSNLFQFHCMLSKTYYIWLRGLFCMSRYLCVPTMTLDDCPGGFDLGNVPTKFHILSYPQFAIAVVAEIYCPGCHG